MALETVDWNLPQVYKQLSPDAMLLHVDQLMRERSTNIDLPKQGCYSSDGLVYFLKGAKRIPTLAITRKYCNPFLKNIDNAFEQVTEKSNNDGNYRVTQEDLEQVLASPETVLISLLGLRLPQDYSEYPNLGIDLIIKTNPPEFNKLNSEEQKLAERLCGQESDFVQNMKRLKDANMDALVVNLPGPDYVRKHAKEGAFARLLFLNFSANWVNLHPYCRDSFNRIRAHVVRSEVVSSSLSYRTAPTTIDYYVLADSKDMKLN